MKRAILFIITVTAIIHSYGASKDTHMFFDLAGVYMGTKNGQFKKDILNNGAIIPSVDSKELNDTYDIFFEGEVIRIYAINHDKKGRIDRIGLFFYRDTENEILSLLKSFTKREMSQHNCYVEAFEANGHPAYALLVYSPKDKDRKKDPIGAIDIRIHFDDEDDESSYSLDVIYDDWVE